MAKDSTTSSRPSRSDVAPPADSADGPLRVAWLEAGELCEDEGEAAIGRVPALVAQPGSSVWVDLTSPRSELVERVGTALSIHALVVEDVLEGNQRAKVEQTDSVAQIVLFWLDFEAETPASEIDIVLGDRFLLTVHTSAWDPRSGHHLKGAGLGEIMKAGPDHLLWALSDDVVDAYFPFADRLGDALDDIQDEVVREASARSLERLFSIKRELITIRRAISPVREVFNQLTNRDTALIDPAEIVFFRDVYDHVIRLTDELDNYRELASATLDVYLTQVNNNLSLIMKRLTGVTVILAGIGAIAGIFGMSEAGAALAGNEHTGFWLVTALAVALAVLAAAVLNRIGWI